MKIWRWLRRAYLRWQYTRQIAAIVALRHSKQVSSEGLRLMQLKTIETLQKLKRLEQA